MKRPSPLPVLAIAALAAAGAGSRAAAIEIKVLAFGDSLTFGIGDEEGLGYPKRLEPMLGENATVVNLGEPAEETAMGLSRIGPALGEGGDVLLLMEGTNDVTHMVEGGLSVESTLANIDAMITKTREAGIEPVLSSVVPRSPRARRDRKNRVTASFVGELRELAISRNLRFADAYDLFDPETVPEVFADYYDNDEADRIGHLNGVGYDKLANAFADLLNKIDSQPPVVGNFEPGPLPNKVPADIRIRIPVYDFKNGDGLDLEATRLLINGNVVADGTDGNGDNKKVELVHQGKKALGCRAVLRVLARDLAQPPNALDRTVAIYDIDGRTVLPGDVNFDCSIDGADLVSFALHFGLDSTDPGYLLTWDFTRDGFIDEIDLDTLSRNFGKSSL